MMPANTDEVPQKTIATTHKPFSVELSPPDTLALLDLWHLVLLDLSQRGTVLVATIKYDHKCHVQSVTHSVTHSFDDYLDWPALR